MEAEYIIREIEISKLTDSKISEDVLELVDYIQDIINNCTYVMEEDGTEMWTNKYGQWIFQSNVKHKIFWVYANVVWQRLVHNYNIRQNNVGKVLKCILQYLNYSNSFIISDRNYKNVNGNSFDIKHNF